MAPQTAEEDPVMDILYSADPCPVAILMVEYFKEIAKNTGLDQY